MLKDRKFFDPFRTEKRRNVFVLTVSIVRNTKKADVQMEIIDGYHGEVGYRYAQKLLFRMANHVLAGTEFENLPWEEFRDKRLIPGKEFGYIKSMEQGKYVLAAAKWHAEVKKENLSSVTIG